MKTFYDKDGREWRIAIDLPMASRIKSLLNVNLFAVFDDQWKIYRDITTDPEVLLNVLYRLCQEQVDHRRMSIEEFVKGLAGDLLARAMDALTGELLDFFPDARKRAWHRQTWRMVQEWNQEILNSPTIRNNWRISSVARWVFRRMASPFARFSGCTKVPATRPPRASA